MKKEICSHQSDALNHTINHLGQSLGATAVGFSDLSILP